MSTEGLTNREFAEQDQNFKERCKRAKVKPTKCQASKFRNKRGLAYTDGGASLSKKEEK